MSVPHTQHTGWWARTRVCPPTPLPHPCLHLWLPTEPGLNGRFLNYARGKVLGGCTSINGMIYMRGQSADYDHWRGVPPARDHKAVCTAI